ncbi:hypothetical protein OOT46_15410 [Aquabacterium sp. A7-Y]|uniref:hypothetical protein n=1 Tax=Aquabacterium sp. A7-Y TaxID=1349605 RepID=UPI00223E4F18|nr:hypothetical protein [Aquabacterium sp. A7-Y]MCW7539231.1 hypothetical protein [Aquabacterium sp. A7-Y]
MNSPLVLGTLHLPRHRRVQFELRDGRWLTDDPAQALRWHDGPFSVSSEGTALRIANDMDPALMLHRLDPAVVQRGERGPGVLLEANDTNEARCELEWEVTEVVSAGGRDGR